MVQCKFSYSNTSADARQSSSTLEVFITLYVSLLFVAPRPTATLSASPNGTIYSGSILLLTCTAQISAEIDTAVVVNITWRKSGVLLANQGRTTVVSPTQVGAFVYQSTAEFSPVSQQLDSGLYTCEVMVTPSPPSSFVTSATSLGSLSVTVHGESTVLWNCSTEELWIRLLFTCI